LPAYSFNIGTGQTLNFTNAAAGPAGGITGFASATKILNGGILNFVGNSVTGGATIITLGGGVTTFATGGTGNAIGSRLNADFGGSFDISRVTAAFTAGSIEGDGDYFLGSKLFAVGSDNTSSTVTGVIQDNGSGGGVGGKLLKDGLGTLTLTGVNTYTGFTFIDGGTLIVDGSIAASANTFVNPDAILAGSGTVGNTTVQAGGIFAPGSSSVPGSQMTVAGSLAFASGAIYMVQINPASASSANVSNVGTLAGTVNAQFAPGSYVARTYTILSTANGLGGTTFDSLTTNNLPGGFTAHLSYQSDHDVILNLTAVLGVALGVPLNRNQQSAATAINNFFNNGGALPPSFVTVFGLTGAAAANALTQLSGETATGSQQTTFNAMTQFMGVMTDPFMVGRGGGAITGAGAASFADENNTGKTARDAYGMFAKAPLAQSYDPRWSVWAAGFGGSQTTDGSISAGSNTTTSSVFGTAVGADYRFSPFTIAGFALAGGGTNFSVANGGSGRSDLFQAGAFLHHTVGPAYLSAALAYGWQDITTDRTVTAAGIDRLHAAFNANAFSGRLESGYRFATPWIGGMGLTPYAAAQFTTFDLPAYAESAAAGSNAFALAYGSKSVTDARSELGLRTDKSFAMQNAILTLRGRAAWAHDFNPDRAIAATFQTLPGASFVVNGAAQAHDSALTTASAEMKWLNGWSAAATFEGEFSEVTRSYAGKGVVRYAW
jgi:autotransporter-associated beta strand protein